MYTNKKNGKIKVLFTLMCLFCLSVLLFSEKDVQAAYMKKAALKAYKVFLSQKTIKWSDTTPNLPLSKCTFTLAYIDGDSIPELIIGSGSSTSHAEGYYQLYTYKNGKVTYVDNLMDGFAYYKKKGVYCSSHSGTGGVETYYYKFSKGKIEYKLHSIDERQSGFDLNNDGKITIYYEQVIKAQNPFYQSVTKGIGKKLFNGELQKLTGKTKKKTVKKLYDNTAANRKKRIK